jgi:hypothetical protein
MMTRQHRQEAMSRAYVQAVAAKAGVLCSRPEPDYGIDLSLRAVVVHGRHHDDSSVQIDLRLRSTKRANVTSTAVTYDLEVGTYDSLRRISAGCPRLLVVYIMPDDESDWLEQSAEQLCLHHCAYWLSLEGAAPTSATKTIRIFLPLANIFSAEAVRALLQQAQQRSQP